MRYFVVFISILIIALVAVIGFITFKPNSSEVVAVSEAPSALVRYRLDPAKSQFMVHAQRAGPVRSGERTHSHDIAVRDFNGEVSMVLDAVNPASLEMTVTSASLKETNDEFTARQKVIINKELQTIVLQTAKYPEIAFKSTDVTGDLRNGALDLKIGGDITLHGVTRHIVIPATVTAQGDTVRANGEFRLSRSDFHVKATSIYHGPVRLGNTLKFKFDIVGDRI